MRRLTVWLGAAVLMLTACSRQASTPVDDQPPASPAAAPASSPDNPQRPTIVALGDSLTAGLGLLEIQAYPALLQESSNEDGLHLGSRQRRGLGRHLGRRAAAARLGAEQGDVRILIVALGANDGLRGLPVAEMKKNLAADHRARPRAADRGHAGRNGGAAELRAGIHRSFRQAYRDSRAKYSVTFIPFLLDKVAGDGGAEPVRRHPSQHRGRPIVADTRLDGLEPMVDAAGGS